MMKDDPVVREVRQAGARLARAAGGDLHVFFANLRKAQEQYPKRTARSAKAPVLRETRKRYRP
jgi:hypothetical protein